VGLCLLLLLWLWMTTHLTHLSGIDQVHLKPMVGAADPQCVPMSYMLMHLGHSTVDAPYFRMLFGLGLVWFGFYLDE
jgi:hypothetical protein